LHFYCNGHCIKAITQAYAWPYEIYESSSFDYTTVNVLRLSDTENIYNNNVGWDSVVGIVTHYGLGSPGINPDGGEIFCTCLNRPWCPPSRPYKGCQFFPTGEEAKAWS
jgi:hypothetical protein